MVNATVAIARTLGAQEHGAVAIDDRIGRGVAIALAVGRLILKDAGDGDRRVVFRVSRPESASCLLDL